MEETTSIEVREGEIETTDCTGEAVNTARAEDNSARAAEIAEEKANSALSVEVNTRENARKDVQADGIDEDTQPEKQKKKRKRRKKKAQADASSSATSAVSTAGDATLETTEQPTEAARTNQNQSEGKKRRRSKRKRKERSQLSEKTAGETSHVLENIVNGDDLNASFSAGDDKDEQKARGEDFVTASSAVSTANDATLETTEQPNEAARTNQNQSEGKKRRRSKRKRKESSQLSEKTSGETSHVLENMVNGDDLNASFSAGDDKDEQKARGEDFVAVSSAVPTCDARRPECDVTYSS